MTLRISLLGHASVLIEAGPLRIVSDPWYRGRAFNDGWDIHPAPVWEPASLADATHLWISHEHPDHLSIPTLKAVPPEIRGRLTVLFQRTWSSHVVEFLESLGFAEVVELDHGRKVALGSGVQVMCWQVGHQDSALAVRHGGRTVLNLTDCKPSVAGLHRLASETGPIDVLLDQFSIAGWAGNPDDASALAASRRGAVDTLCRHVEHLRPAATIPFASFMRFCHRENSYLNAASVSFGDLVARWEAGLPGRLVLLHHGDAWSPGEPEPDRDVALDRDLRHRDDRAAAPLITSDPVDADAVTSSLHGLMEQWRRTFSAPALRAVTDPVLFRVEDLDLEVVVDPAGRARRPETVVHLNSQAAWFAGAQRFGVETLLISGRFRLSGDGRGWRRLKRLGGAYAAGLHPRSAPRTVASPRARAVLAGRSRLLLRDALRRSTT